jgi:hypothetical protein
MPIHTDLKVFEKYATEYEREKMPMGQIVFYGPSYFKRWCEKWGHRPLREDLLGVSGAPCCINRGVGGSCPEHQLYYYDRIVRPLAPKVLVYGSWGNIGYLGYTNEEAIELAERVVAYARADFPNIKIYLMGAIYTINQEYGETLAYREEYNEMVRKLAARTPNCTFIDPYACKALWDHDIFIEDNVHYNQQGFDRFGDFFREALAEELAAF